MGGHVRHAGFDKVVEQVIDVARLTDVAAAAFRPVDPVIGWDVACVHLVVAMRASCGARRPSFARRAAGEKRRLNPVISSGPSRVS